jgi:hypothetical protein
MHKQIQIQCTATPWVAKLDKENLFMYIESVNEKGREGNPKRIARLEWIDANGLEDVHKNSSRIVECVNSFAGIENPKTAMQFIKQSIYDAHNILSCVVCDNDYKIKTYQNILTAWHLMERNKRSGG